MSESSETKGGIRLAWGAEHKDKDGNLISRQASIEEPTAPTCLRLDCLLKYMWRVLFFTLLANYHVRRVAYAEANRNSKILERYRTGEPSPKNVWQAIHANLKLACPICRIYGVDPLLFSRRKKSEEGTG